MPSARSVRRPKPARAPGPPLPNNTRLDEFLRGRAVYGVVSLLLLVPCFWHSRIQAGDLGSHIYNAWLAQLIHAGKAPGLAIVPQTTNVLFDLLLSGLLPIVGAGAAQRIAVSLAVLVLGWGAFAFVSVVAGGRAWRAMPAIAILAYGWAFHMGFFNFYLSLGLCLGALALAWGWKPWRLAGAAALLAVAYTAHGLPVAWSAALIAYFWLARRQTPRGQVYLAAAAILGLFFARAAVGMFASSARWYVQQITSTSGLDQLLVFDGKYRLPFLGLLLVWLAMAAGLLRQSGWRKFVASLPFQLCALTAAGVFVIPSAIRLPIYKHSLVYIAERMSLAVGILVCAVVVAAPARRYLPYLMGATVLLFFGFLYRDEGALNALEDRMTSAVAQLPPFERVISAIDDPGLRVNAAAHMIDRACLGRCYSYANYEPSTAQFRIRVLGKNGIVAPDYDASYGMQTGRYVVQESDLPLYQVDLDPSGAMVTRMLAAGKECGATYWGIL